MHYNTPLHLAAHYITDVNIINLLLYCSDPNILNAHRRNALMIACTEGRVNVINAMINVTYDINLQDSDGNTATKRSINMKQLNVLLRVEQSVILQIMQAKHRMIDAINEVDKSLIIYIKLYSIRSFYLNSNLQNIFSQNIFFYKNVQSGRCSSVDKSRH